MIVCVAEKPSVAADIAHVIGATVRKDGYWEGNGYQVAWTFGHLCELKYPEDYTPRWKTWSLGSLPIIPQPFGIRLKNDAGIHKQFNVIARLFAEADSIINCGDAGQEGELIQRWVMQMAGVRCPVYRLWISSLTEESIREGFHNLKPQSDYQQLYEAGMCRAIGDWLLGMNASRLYTLKYGDHSRQAPPLSVGRVQTPTLALIVARQREIDNFVPEPYWVLSARYREVLFTAAEGKYTNKEKAEAALKQIEGQLLTVEGVTKKQGREAPPRLFDLTSLQVECNKKFAFSADLTLSIIQSLYEKKLTTYPRVDTTYLSEDIYDKCPGILRGLQQYDALLQPLRGKKLPKSKKVFDSSKVTDHHAIIPTGQIARGMTDAEAKVYDLVARRFIAAFYPDCEFTTTTVMADVAGIAFKATGRQVQKPGWRYVYAADKKAQETEENEGERTKEEERLLPDFVKGEQGEQQPELSEKTTTPPRPYDEASLLRAMETAGKSVADEDLRDALKENGIGRPSTRAAIIETLFRRRYITRQRKALLPTPTGIGLIDIIHEDLLKSAELTGRWEKKLRDIEHGTYTSATFVSELKEMVQTIINQVLSDNAGRRVAVTPEAKDNKTKSGDKKRTTKNKKGTDEPTTKRKAKTTKDVAPSDALIGTTCPLCGQGHIIKGRTAYGCSRYAEGCTYRIPFETT